MIDSFQLLRILFSVIIFLHHYTINGESLFEAGGTFGVSFFFILSGFVLTLGYKERVLAADFSYFQFIKKRFLKIYPLHLLCLFAYIILSFKTLDIQSLIRLIPNVFLLQSWVPHSSFYFSGNALSWYLSNTLFFYTVFPFLIRTWAKRSWPQKKLLIATIMVFYLVAIFIIPFKYSHAIFYISPATRILDFILGIAVCECYLNKKKQYLRCGGGCFLIVALLITTPCIYNLYNNLQPSFFYSGYYWGPVGLIIMLSAFNKKSISNNTISQIIKTCSDSSFTFYMIHLIGLRVINQIVTKYSIELPHIIQLIISFTIIAVSAYCIENYINKPIAVYLNKSIR